MAGLSPRCEGAAPLDAEHRVPPSGTPSVAVAQRLGHTVGMLHEVYAHAIPGQEDVGADASERIFG